ncbi:MAG: cell division protein ZapA [Acidobacteriota bacterium]|nr:MAG: cell division protein ZapA [Acidobacteriota bacterium]
MSQRKRTSPPSGTPVEVMIAGRRYRLRGSDADQLHRLAARVDDTLNELAGDDAPPDDFKLAVLAALNLAGDHEEDRTLWREQFSQLRQRAGALGQRLERIAARLAEARR